MRYVAIRISSYVRSICAVLGALTLVAVMSAPAAAQSVGAGSIGGVVKDSKGGVIVGATVTIADPSQGVSKTDTTGSAGEFAFPSIPPGNYTVTVDATGFKTTVKTDVHVPVDTKIDVGDVVLEVGSVSETVTVRAEGGQLQLQSESGERSAVVTGTQLRNLALNGANVSDMFKIVPGVLLGGATTQSALSAIGNLNIDGTRASQHEYVVDGITNFNVGNDTAGLVTVNIDALQEVKIETNNYSAEYGRSGGGYIALETKSGTADYHGGASYFRRNQTMNADSVANDWANAVVTPTPYNKNPASLYDYNYYGWNFGGPVWIPKVFNGKQHKLYFFIDQEYYRQLVPVTSPTNLIVPTAAQETGNFAGLTNGNGAAIQLVDPCPTGPAFTGDVIPNITNPCTGQSFIYAPGVSALAFLPAPNVTGITAYNYTSELSNAYPRTETILRGDYQINDSTRLSISWVHNHDDQQFHLGTTTESWNWPLDIVNRFNGPGNVQQITLTKNFGPTWVNEFTFGEARGHVSILPEGDAATRAATGVDTPFVFPNADVANLIPSLSFGGITGAAGTPSTSVTGLFYQNFVIWQVMDNLSKVWGRHIFKFGLYVESSLNQSTSQSNTESTINFSSSQSGFTLDSGYPYANAVLGVYGSYSQVSQQVMQNFLYHDVSWYLEDTWKVTNALTLDLGFRFSYWQPTYDNNENEGFFNPTLFSAANAPQLYYPVCIGATTCAAGQSTYRAMPLAADSSASAVAAAVAAATLANTQPGYDVGREVPGTGSLTNGLVSTPAALGYPIAGFTTPSLIYQPRLGFAWDLGGHHNSVIRGGFGIAPDRYETESCGSTNSPITTTPTYNNGYLQTLTSSGGALGVPAVCGFGKNEQFPQVYSYSMGLQKNIGAGTVLDVAYVGNQSRHLLREQDLNSVPYGTDFQAFAQDPTQYTGGVIPANEGLEAGSSFALYPEYVAAGVNFMGDHILPSSDFVRPYAGYDQITFYTFDANSHYNSLQVNLSRKFLKQLTFTAAYTLGQVRTTIPSDGTLTNYLSAQRFDYQLANFDHKNTFVASFVWNMPGVARFMGDNKISRAFFNNWILAGITTAESGAPLELTPSLGSGGDFTTRVLGTPGGGGQSARFFLSGNPQYGTANDSLVPGSFVVPQIGQIGPYPRTYARGPGLYNQDLSIYKDFPFNESGSRYLQLRMEAFNAFNHPEYTGFNTSTTLVNALGNTTGTTGANSIFAAYYGLGITNNLRGTNTSKQQGSFFGEWNGANPQRVVQIAAKFYF
jgi:carboxypeptidase family protein/TonB-dependent receptor-like protein